MYLLYQITNLVNRKIYIGAHEGTPDDNYLGSGVGIHRAIKKYGRDNFRKDILATVDTEAFLYKLEAAVVNENFVSRRDTYNLNVGGNRPPKSTPASNAKAAQTRTGMIRGPYKSSKPASEQRKQRVRASLMGHVVSAETRRKMSLAKRPAPWNKGLRKGVI